MNIAVVGTGISGLAAAYVLSNSHRVDVFEKEAYAGGHAHTVTVAGPDGPQPVDTGFIVYNERNYPHLTRLLNELHVATLPSDMSFGVYDPVKPWAYSSRGLGGLFALPGQACSLPFYRMVRDILRFNRTARRTITAGTEEEMTLGDYLAEHAFSQEFERYYITPMSAAIWSAPPGNTLAYPVQTFLRFFNNHGLLNVAPEIPWRTIQGGSRMYVRAITRTLGSRLHLNRPVQRIVRTDNGVRLSFADGTERHYERVVIAVHADQALQLLADPSDEESRLLAKYPYQLNRVVLHNDTSVLPPYPRAHASWNVRVPTEAKGDTPLSMTYDMNRLQRIPGDNRYLVTLNPDSDWLERLRNGDAGATCYFDTEYAHPAYQTDSFLLHHQLPALNGVRHTYYCGAWFGYGFHEDGLQSGLEAARALGAAGDI